MAIDKKKRKLTKKVKKQKEKNSFMGNIKAFAIFFVALMTIDIVLFVVTSSNVDRNYLYLIVSNMSLAMIMQFFYIRFAKKGLYISSIIVAILLLFTIIEIILYKTYGVFMPLRSAINNAKNVRENYSDELLKVVANNITFIIRFIIFYAVFVVTTDEYLIRKHSIEKFSEQNGNIKKINYAVLIASILVFIISFIMIDKTNDFSLNVQKYGLKAGFVRSFYKSSESINVNTSANVVGIKTDDFLEKYNIMDIDFENLDESNVEESCRNVNRYMATRVPSNKNDYTGIFKGKNLILICAEAYSHYVLNEKLTPTLYRLTNNGFKFTDYYVPSWGGSTTSGEFAFLNGLIPSDATESMKNTISKNMCFAMPRVLKREGYNTGAYHNGNYKYYDRHLTHRENMGFDFFIANGNGLEDLAGLWATDEAMMEKTLETYKDSAPFCMYYMTLSGHAFYNDPDNFKVIKNINKVKEVYGDKYPDQVNYYICYQMYLEDAVSKLVEGLEKYGLLDDTVICMTSDHFPYGLNSASFTKGVNYLPYLYGKEELDEFDLDKNMPILWCKSLEDEHLSLNKVVDDPTSTIDLLPTLFNLFGAEYDSRLIAGRDVFSEEVPFVVYNSGSFITKEGKFSKRTNRFVPNDGVEVSKEYVELCKEKARNLILFSAYEVIGNYYDYVFTNEKLPEAVRNRMGSLDMTIPVTLAKKDYSHFVEYFKKCNEKYLNKNRTSDNTSLKKATADSEKIVYLTFDDGPNKYLDKILKILNDRDVKATFFVTGTSKDKEIKKIKSDGHTIGLHSASHNYSYIYRSEEDFLYDLYELQNFVYQATGEYSHYLRFPGGSKNKVSDEVNPGIMNKLRPLVEDLGFEYFDWHIATGDSAIESTKESILSNVERGLLNDYDELIILMHDLHPVTVDVLGEVIELCRSKNYVFKKIDDSSYAFHSIGVG